jgi:hypothetical protein
MAQLDIDDPLYEEPKPKRHREPFVQMTHNSLLAGSHALRGTKQFLVWVYIHYKVWAEKSDTVRVSNAALRPWGVKRRAKYKALRLLEEANLIKINREGRNHLTVTLIEV